MITFIGLIGLAYVLNFNDCSDIVDLFQSMNGSIIDRPRHDDL